jgi:hypothetical protein
MGSSSGKMASGVWSRQQDPHSNAQRGHGSQLGQGGCYHVTAFFPTHHLSLHRKFCTILEEPWLRKVNQYLQSRSGITQVKRKSH